jgi:uncharacterized protein
MQMKKEYSEVIKRLTEKELLFHLYLTQIILLTVSFILGLFLFDSIYELGALFSWEDPMIWKLGVTAGIVVVGIDLIFMKVLPTSVYDDGGLNERIFRNRNILHIAFIAAIVAISEEILFRGVIQTHFGLVISSIIFAIVHYRYLFNWFLFLNIITLSFVIGFIYLRTENLAVTVAMHFLIDFLLGVIIRFKKTGK